MRLLLVVLVGYVAATNNTTSINKRAIDGGIHTIKKSEVIEGSGDESALKHSVSSPDTEIHGSGYGSDDEDGESVHGSGTSMVDVIEGSGAVPSMIQQRPQVTTTTTTTHMPPVHSHSDTEHVSVITMYSAVFFSIIVISRTCHHHSFRCAKSAVSYRLNSVM
ncbi:hypothetical protein COOONC_28186 [Cooperia oncophora]